MQLFPNPTLLFRNMKSDQAERTQLGRRREQNAVAFRIEQVDLEAVLGKLDEPLDAEPRTLNGVCPTGSTLA